MNRLLGNVTGDFEKSHIALYRENHNTGMANQGPKGRR